MSNSSNFAPISIPFEKFHCFVMVQNSIRGVQLMIHVLELQKLRLTVKGYLPLS